MKKTLISALVTLAFAGVAQAAASCPLPDNQANVVIGHLSTVAPNVVASGNCTLNDLILEEGNYTSQTAWIAHVSSVLNDLPAGTLTQAQKDDILGKAASYDIKRYQRVKLLAINDFHGQLTQPSNGLSTPSGGIDWLGGYIKALRAKNPEGTIFLSAGDLIGATPLVSAFFHDEPTIEAMNLLGLEYNVVGNHEFDEGKTEILRMQNGGCHPTDPISCQGPKGRFDGAKFKFISTNVNNQDNNTTLFPPYFIKQVGGTRIAIMGAVLEETPTVVTPTGVAGLSFQDEAEALNAIVRQIRNRGAETIVALIHQGGIQTGSVANIAQANACNNLTGPIRNIVSHLDSNIDAVITAHTHQWYNCRLPAADGKLIPVTQADSIGRGITEVDLTIDRTTRNPVGITTRNHLVARNNALITPVAELKALTDAYAAKAAPIANVVIGSITTDVCNGYRNSGTCATPAAQAAFSDGISAAGALIADAQLDYTQRPGFGDAVIAMMNVGGVREGFYYNQSGTEGNGNVTFGEAFTVQPFGNSLVSIDMTGGQIEQVLEQQFAGCNGQTTNRILQISKGLRYEYSASAPACSKINPASITLNGVPLERTTQYRVSVNNFLADGGDGFTVFLQGTNRLGGAQDLDAMTRYLSLNPAYSPIDFTVPANKRAVKLP